MELSTQLEAALFVAGEPVPLLTLARAFNVSLEDLRGALTALEKRYEAAATGIRLLRSSEGVQLVTVPEAHEAVEAFVTHSIRERLTPAAAETLALIAYRGPISRAGIEAIRGVNSSFTLRLLALRGLVTREFHPKDRRSFVYQVSAEFLRHLGVTAVDELPDYAQLHAHVSMAKLAEEAEAASASRAPTTPPPSPSASSTA